jgi:hypothetical protein
MAFDLTDRELTSSGYEDAARTEDTNWYLKELRMTAVLLNPK